MSKNTWLAGCPCCEHRWKTTEDWRNGNPIKCPKCKLFFFCYACNHCEVLTFMPNSSGQCWSCKRLIPKAGSTAGFFGHTFSIACPACSKKEKVVCFPEYPVKRTKDLALEPVIGAMTPWLIPINKVLYRTEYFCSSCGCAWNTHRTETSINFA